MKTIVRLTGPAQPVRRLGTKCRKSTTYEWELPAVSTGALTRLRIELAKHATSGNAHPLRTDKELDDNEEEFILVALVLKQPVLRGTVVMVNTAVKRALRG